MRLLILGVSALSLGACTMGGVGYGASHAGYESSPSVGHGSWQGGQNAVYTQHSAPGFAHNPAPGFGSAPCGYDPCAGVYQPAQYIPPAPPAPVYPQPQYAAPGCQPVDPCASPYSVSQNQYGAPAGHNYHAEPSYGGYGYGQPQGYGHAGPSRARGPLFSNQSYTYGTIGAVWYDVDQPFAGLQGRLGYQSASIIGGEIEGSIGVIGETSPFNQDIGGGTILSGERKDGVEYSVAAFATARLPFSHNLSGHARLGYHSTKSFADVNFDNLPNQDTTLTRDGIAYGAGLQFEMTPVDAVRVDYTRYDDDIDGNDAVSLAYLRRF